MADLSRKPAGRQVNGKTVSDEEFKSMLGEGVHTGLRKGSGAPSAPALHTAIAQSDDGAWGDALGYAVWGLRFMGYELVKVEHES
ncbi:hypothetical protein SEA_RASPUTIA_144 [Microbacterium phage Rasputia]|nr:hypothetical protein SEA_RASPUTIA_144 [Microbacterium phage Rasputia]